MTRQQVDLDRLRDVVDQMARFDTGLETALADIDRRITRLHTQWTGQAADEHRAAHQRWLRGAAEMRQALAVMRAIAEGAHGNYGNAVATNTRMWTL